MNIMTIESLLTRPDDWQWNDFKNKNNQHIRFGWNCPKGAKALIIIAEGRTETIEEYFETIRNFNDKGYAVAIMDWQGQGLSYRHNDDNTRQHSIGFEQDVSDFTEFLSQIKTISAFQTMDKHLIAHSMGGNLSLRYLAGDNTEFQSAFLVAPMLGLNPKRIIKYTGKAILGMAKKFHWMGKHALGQTAWNETFANIEKHKVSSDPIRREVQPYLYRTRPELRCGGVTFGWLDMALQSIQILHNPDICKTITTPVFIAIAGSDIVVDNDGTRLTASLLPNCQTKTYDKSQHQILREVDDIRTPLLNDFFDFIEKHSSPTS